MKLSLRSAILVLGSGALVSGCGTSVADWDCAQIATKATELSQEQPIKIRDIANVRETARTPTDARCEGTANLADGSAGTVYLRAYEEGSNIMVAYQGTPFPN